MNKKKILILSISIVILVLILFFLVFYYKTVKSGNTMINKSEEEILDYILKIKSYTAKMDILIETNKNKTQYVVKQTVNENISKQEVLEPSNVAGVITEYNGKDLKISNDKLNLSTTFNDYSYVVENRLWLNSFIEEYKNNTSSKCSVNENNEIILELKKDNNKYNVYETLYIDKKTAKPVKLVIKDINKKTLVYILYTEIEISK